MLRFSSIRLSMVIFVAAGCFIAASAASALVAKPSPSPSPQASECVPCEESAAGVLNSCIPEPTAAPCTTEACREAELTTVREIIRELPQDYIDYINGALEDRSGDFATMGFMGKITAKMCRDACMEEGMPEALCRALCRMLKNCHCAGLSSLCQHLMRAGQKRLAEACMATYINQANKHPALKRLERRSGWGS